jgi:hypothetical protein
MKERKQTAAHPLSNVNHCNPAKRLPLQAEQEPFHCPKINAKELYYRFYALMCILGRRQYG